MEAKKLTQEQIFVSYLNQLIRLHKNKRAIDSMIVFRDNFRTKGVTHGKPKMKSKRCFNNAIDILAQTKGAKYVEGYVCAPIPVVHAWNELPDGEWVDHTLPDAHKFPYYGLTIPTALLLMTAQSKTWVMAHGVFESLFLMPPEEMEQILVDCLPDKAPRVIACKNRRRVQIDLCRRKCTEKCKAYADVLLMAFGL